jgi:hypothetical protein
MNKGLPKLTVEELYNVSIGLRPDGSSPKNAKNDVKKLKNMDSEDIKKSTKKTEDIELKHEKKEKIKPFDPTELGVYEQCNIIIPSNSQILMKQIDGFKMVLGKINKDIDEDTFKNFLNKNNVIVNKFGVYGRFNIYVLHRGFDPNYVYIFRENTYIHKTKVMDKYQAFNIVVEYINTPQIDEDLENDVIGTSETKEKRSILNDYLNKIKNI